MVNNKVCIVGAGITGITVAKNLRKSGLQVFLLDKNPYPGGRALYYGCKATTNCVHCGVCLIRDTLSSFDINKNIKLLLSSSIKNVERNGSNDYQIQVECNPNRIDPKKCIECGLCVPVCPCDAVKKTPDSFYYIDQSCTECGKCVDVCPVSAINLKPQIKKEILDVNFIAVCTGFSPFDPSINLKWGYGKNPYVITGSDLEKYLFEENYPGEHVKKIAFIQCVGSRNNTEGEVICSRICCAYGLRMANRIKFEKPDVEIDFYYMDIQKFGKNFDKFWTEVTGRINFIQSNPISVKTDSKGKPVVRYEFLKTAACEENTYDLLVLSQGLCPRQDSANIADLFGLNIEPNGYFSQNPEANLSNIFISGTCKGPMRIDECIQDAVSVSKYIISKLEKSSSCLK